MHTQGEAVQLPFLALFCRVPPMNVCLPDASVLKDKTEGSHKRIKQKRSFLLVPFTQQ